MPITLKDAKKVAQTRRVFERSLGLSPGQASTLRDAIDALAPATGPAGFAAGMMEPPREGAYQFKRPTLPATLKEARALGMDPRNFLQLQRFEEEGGSAAVSPQSLSMLMGVGVPLMLGKASTQGQRTFKQVGRKLRDLMKGTRVVEPGTTQPKRVFHGTTAAFEQFDPKLRGEGAGGDLYGPGFYFTEKAEIAGGPSAETSFTNLGYASLPSAGKARFSKIAPPGQNPPRIPEIGDVWSSGNIVTDVRDMGNYYVVSFSEGLGSPNVRPAFLDIKKPFDIEGKIPLSEAKRLWQLTPAAQRLSFEEALVENFPSFPMSSFTRKRSSEMQLPTKSVYSTLVGLGFEENPMIGRPDTGTVFADQKARVSALLQQAGYDGITHLGGTVTGGDSHRVWIAFEPSQVHSAFEPGAPTHFRTRSKRP